MKTSFKRWWQVVVPVVVVSAFAGLTTTQTGCGGSSCVNVAGNWSFTEVVTASNCPGISPGDTRTDTQTMSQTGCDVTFPGQPGLTGKSSGNTVTLSGQEAGWTYGGNPVKRNITSSPFNVSGTTFTGTLNWGFSLPATCSGTSTMSGTKM